VVAGFIVFTQPVVAQNLPSRSTILSPLPAPVSKSDIPAKDEISPEFYHYILNTGDAISVMIQRPPGQYHLSNGDAINVTVQRFSDLNFQAIINPEGNIIVPLLGNLHLQGLTLDAAKEKIRSTLDHYVVEPKVTLSLITQHQDLSFQTTIAIDGSIIVPQVGKLSLQGLSLEAAQEKIRLATSKILPEPIVAVALLQPRPVQITVTGEVFRPGIYTINASVPHIVDVLPLVGGTTLAADLRKVQVRRKLADGLILSQNIDLYSVLLNGNAPPNLRLQDGDAIIVPHREVANDKSYDRNLISRSSLAVSQIKVRVLNYSAGGIITQTLPNGSSFLDALSGVSLDTANLHSVALIRFNPDQGKAITRKLDAKRALAGDISQNVPLQDNDVIVVGRNLIGRLSNLLSTLTQPFYNIQSFTNFFQNFGNGLVGK